jgi:outer membrane protein
MIPPLRLSCLVLTCGILLRATCSPGFAADEQAAKGPEAKTPDWTVDLGASFIAAPRFDGSNRFLYLPVPYVGVNWQDTVFASVKDGVGANLYNTEVLKAGVIARPNFGRYRSNDRRYLTGLNDVDWTVEAGGFVKYTPLPFLTTSLEVRQGVGGHEGLIAEWSADLSAPPLLDDRLFLSVGPRVSASNQQYNQGFYGVTPAESVRSGYGLYKPSAGFRSVGVGGGAIYRVTDTVTFTLFADYARLVGPAAKSPIVKGGGGSENQFTVGTALTYRFTY